MIDCFFSYLKLDWSDYMNDIFKDMQAKAEKEIDALEKKKSKLVDMRLEEVVDKETYESKYADLVSKQEQLVEARKKLQETSENEKDIKNV